MGGQTSDDRFGEDVYHDEPGFPTDCKDGCHGYCDKGKNGINDYPNDWSKESEFDKSCSNINNVSDHTYIPVCTVARVGGDICRCGLSPDDCKVWMHTDEYESFENIPEDKNCDDTYRESKGNGYEYSTKQEAKNACEESELRLCAKHEIIDKDICSYGWTSDADVGYPMAHGIAWYDHRANHEDPNIQKTKYWCGGRTDGWRNGGRRKAKAFCCAKGPERKEHRFIEGKISHNNTNYADNTRLFVKTCDNNLSFEWFWKHKHQKQNIDCAHEDGILNCDIDQRYGVQQGIKPYYNTFRMTDPRSGVWGRNGIIVGRLTLDEDL